MSDSKFEHRMQLAREGWKRFIGSGEAASMTIHMKTSGLNQYEQVELAFMIGYEQALKSAEGQQHGKN